MRSDAEKTALRVRLRGMRRRLAEETPDAAERALRWFPATRFARFTTVAAYWAQGSEMNPRPLLDAIMAIEPGKMRAALPVAVDRKSALKFRLWRADELLVPD